MMLLVVMTGLYSWSLCMFACVTWRLCCRESSARERWAPSLAAAPQTEETPGKTIDGDCISDCTFSISAKSSTKIK